MKLATLTPQQKKDIRDGKTTTITTKDGVQVIVTPHLVAHAKEVIASGGGEIRILPKVVGQNRMEEVRITL